MSGISCVENDLQYSTNLYTTNLELALMGIQSTAQFVEKYHHIIGGTAMQKSKSSSSVVHHGSRLVAKKIWRSRSKSTSRASNLPSIWTPQGKCTWAGTGGRRVTLQDTSLRSLSEIERKVLCKVAVAKLQALNLGVHIRPPSESLGSGAVATKPKRRAYLLKRKALTTGFFESKGKEEKDKG